MKKFRLYEKILLALSYCADQMVDLIQEGMSKKSRSIYFDPWLGPGYKQSNLNQALHRLYKTGFLEKIIKNGKPFLRLTSEANNKLKRDFPLFDQQRKKWDGRWRIVIFDIKEEEKSQRNILRGKLKELGFGMLQKSIYISPYDFVDDMYEFLKNKDLLGKVFILTAKHELMGDPEDLANIVWRIEDLEDKYWVLWQRIKDLADLGPEEKQKGIQAIKNEYWEILRVDPCLPFDLLPEDWIGEGVRETLTTL